MGFESTQALLRALGRAGQRLVRAAARRLRLLRPLDVEDLFDK